MKIGIAKRAYNYIIIFMLRLYFRVTVFAYAKLLNVYAKHKALAVSSILIILLSECVDENYSTNYGDLSKKIYNYNCEVGLIIIDKIQSEGNIIDREVVIILSRGVESEEAISRILVQAQSEGWYTNSGQGVLEELDTRYTFYSMKSFYYLSYTNCEFISARKSFASTTNKSAGIFTPLFAPSYNIKKTSKNIADKYLVRGHIKAKKIKQAISAIGENYIINKGYIVGQINVNFASPILWYIICPSSDITTSRGEVHDKLVQVSMYGPEFLSETPVIVEWSEINPYFRIISFLPFVFFIISILVYLFHWKHRNQHKSKIYNACMPSSRTAPTQQNITQQSLPNNRVTYNPTNNTFYGTNKLIVKLAIDAIQDLNYKVINTNPVLGIITFDAGISYEPNNGTSCSLLIEQIRPNAFIIIGNGKLYSLGGKLISTDHDGKTKQRVDNVINRMKELSNHMNKT